MWVTQTRFSTSIAPPAQRAALWSEYCREQLTAYRVQILGSDNVDVEVRRSQFPELDLLELSGDGYMLERTPELISTRPSRIMQVGVLLRGRTFIYHPNRIDVLSRGDISFYDTDAPCAYGVSDNYREVVVCVSHDFFTARYGDSYPSEPTVLHASDPELLALRAERLVAMTHSDLSSDLEKAADVAQIALELLDDVLGEGLSNRAGHWIEAREYIRRNLHDQTLSVRRVADSVSLGERQLARVFAARDTSVAKVITEERMRQARALLLDPHNAQLPIFEIAQKVGFASASHFSRTFRATFGMSAHTLRASESAATDA